MKKLLVIGAGPGGYTAAFYAADQGLDVTLVDTESRLGGVCLNKGCIPSKALLHIARLINETREAAEWGLKFSDPTIDLNAMRAWKDSIIGKLTSGLKQLNQQRGLKFVSGHASFLDSNTVNIENGETVSFDHCLIATGSRPVIPAALNLDSPLIMDSTEALELRNIPERLLVVGGGYIGLELGTVYAALGSKVTVVEMTKDLLPGVDRDLVRILQARLRKQFNQIFTSTRLDSLAEKNGVLEACFEGKEEVYEYDRALVSVGRVPNTENLSLENTKVKLTDRNFIQVDQNFKTEEGTISAIGDVIGGAMLAHKASHEAKLAVDFLLNKHIEEKAPTIPAVVFTDPEIALCGISETEAAKSGREVLVSKFPWGASGRATALGRNDGFTKIITEKESGKILGVGIVGVGAGELISEGVLAVEMGATVKDLAHIVHPHPTLSETVMEAAEVAMGISTHVYRKKN
ncbi:MAG: dihydrolipoyl dehydrogenase [Candidatus Nitronauta litoralis]|uniref:Dihydrolipoyl dehydrogenase n=1 Tax=Candidatus Nitronauta litoralis TaxID=2705533 RepID=A0A7T0BYE8_9BACT|nr:MAG: dihydrolipoyl dehydrogenase [Candidatus Nitronauta litoralis]